VTTALALYDAALRRAGRGVAAPLHLVNGGRPLRQLDATRFVQLRRADRSVLNRCAGPTLDLGCGPGRLAAALVADGVAALGVDVSAVAVRATRRRGAPALRRNLFARLPGEGRWRRALLVDGNIGIGGDPVRLLARCAELVAPDGEVLVECEPPAQSSWRGPVALVDGDRTSEVFPWAFVSAADLAACAARAGLRELESWTEAGRWFARLG